MKFVDLVKRFPTVRWLLNWVSIQLRTDRSKVEIEKRVSRWSTCIARCEASCPVKRESLEKSVLRKLVPLCFYRWHREHLGPPKSTPTSATSPAARLAKSLQPTQEIYLQQISRIPKRETAPVRTGEPEPFWKPPGPPTVQPARPTSIGESVRGTT